MIKYHTYSAVDIAFSLLNFAKIQNKSFSNLQIQKLIYVCHGLSLAVFNRPLIIEDIFTSKSGPIIPSVYFRFRSYDLLKINEQAVVYLDHESEGIVHDVVALLGGFTSSQLIVLTCRTGSPWSRVWDGKQLKVIPDVLIQAHYEKVQSTGYTDCL
ncbi:MAG: Panacea domain-containing protein [Enterovibrio sp.]